jgi:hypothetical protein
LIQTVEAVQLNAVFGMHMRQLGIIINRARGLICELEISPTTCAMSGIIVILASAAATDVSGF